MPEGAPLTRLVELDFGTVATVSHDGWKWRFELIVDATEGSGVTTMKVSDYDTKPLRELGEALIAAAQDIDYANKNRSDRDTRIAELVNAGVSKEQVADLFKVPGDIVNQAIRKAKDTDGTV